MYTPTVTAQYDVTESTRPAAASAWGYLALAFAFSWIAWIVAIKLGLDEPYLNIGSAGPAVAAIVLSRRGPSARAGSSVRRWSRFAVLLLVSWVVLSLHYLWRTHAGLGFHLNPWLLAPALLPAWVLSNAQSKE